MQRINTSTFPHQWIHDAGSSREDASDRRPANRPASDADLLDAYSQAVIHVVETVSPAVISVSGAACEVRRRQLGIAAQVTRLPRTLVRELDLLADQGVEVREVTRDSLAAQAGVETGDVVVALAGRLVTSIDDIHRLLMSVPADQGFDLTVLRGDVLETVHVGAVSK